MEPFYSFIPQGSQLYTTTTEIYTSCSLQKSAAAIGHGLDSGVSRSARVVLAGEWRTLWRIPTPLHNHCPVVKSSGFHLGQWSH
ncbi:hypothetical protein CEXT_174861 [Caerostris extrusa]|uniref:Uncharacterized protein n=1 Tax=Caerostris extrusa TaxID=172846 RepID=A0AAV4U352_CAEEX|nr:hypothetical protein CEXT_174861 [Caerostris extrusa]